MAMTPEEKFIFDLQGYLVIKNVLTDAELAELNEVAGSKFPYAGPHSGRGYDIISTWGPALTNLIDHPKIVPYLVELIDPKFRIDHDYCIFMTKGNSRGGLHGGPGYGGDHWYSYRDGVMRNGLCVVTFFLTDAPAGAGGFACIPGSHKTNFKDKLPADVRNFERVPDYVVQPAVEAGDALFFTEALIHGTMPWTADHERRALLYKYSPGHSSWATELYNHDDYGELTEQQKRIMAPPSMNNHPEVVQG
jgi:hypothetical protein